MECAGEDQCIPLIDAMQAVPELQHTIVWYSKVRTLRLVCKSASVLALQVLHQYFLKLAPRPSKTEPLQEVATLLKGIRLQSLEIQLIIPTGMWVCGYQNYPVDVPSTIAEKHICVVNTLWCRHD